MKVVYARRAQADIAEIFDYIADQNPGTAMAVEQDIREACEGLAQMPYANPRTDRPNVFRMPLKRRGFTVFYRVRPRLSVVEIVRIIRGKRVRRLGRIPK